MVGQKRKILSENIKLKGKAHLLYCMLENVPL